MEGGVEHGDVRDAAECLSRCHDAGEVGGVVQRRQHRELIDVDLDQRGDERRLEEPGSAVHHPMPHGHGRAVLERGAAGGERVEHHLEARGVIGDRQLPGGLRVEDGGRGIHPGERRRVDLVRRAPHRLADALDQARGERRLGIHVDQLVLERGRPGVDDEDGGHSDASP